MAVKEAPAVGTETERRLFTEVKSHYDMADEDLRTRIQRKNGFDDADKLFSNYIDESRDKWPYQSVVFDPRVATAIWEKNARLIANKPKGRLVPREGSDEVGAYINNELLSWEWDQVSRVDEPMVAKIAALDMNARKYGSAFGVVTWRYEHRAVMDKDGTAKRKCVYDGPYFKVLDARNVLANPSFSTIKNWFQYREFTTIQDMKAINERSRGEPKYKNLDILQGRLDEESKTRGGDTRSSQYLVKNKAIRGLNDFLGQDTAFKTVEIIHEYRQDRWITFAPQHGVILSDGPNPYRHGEIPVVMLRYNSLGDDLYGFSEIEQVARVQKAINALVCQYLDTIQTDLYPPVLVDSTRVNLNTLEFGPNTKWMVSGGDPRTAIARLETSTAATNSFTQAYSLLVGSLQNALGEASAAFSNLDPFGSQKTATEIKDTSFSRTVRDNSNQIYLSEAVKKITMLWHAMNQQFLFSLPNEKQKIIRIVGRDAINFFNEQGLGDVHPTEQEVQEEAMTGIPSNTGIGPEYPVVGPNGEMKPKFELDHSGQGGYLTIEKEDLGGDFDYIPDIESMRAPTEGETEQKFMQMIQLVSLPPVMQMLAAEGKRPKMSELITRAMEATRVVRDADAFFENTPTPPMDPTMGMSQGLPGAPQGPGGPQPEGGMPTNGQPTEQGPVPNGAGASLGQGGFAAI